MCSIVYTSTSTSLSSLQTLCLPIVCWPVQSSFPSLNKPWTSWHRTLVSAFPLHKPVPSPTWSLSSVLSLRSQPGCHHHPHALYPITIFYFLQSCFSGKKKMHIYFCLSHVPMELSSMQVGINSVLFTSMSPVLQAILTHGSYAINIGYITDWINIWFSFETPKDNGLSNLPLTILSEISSHFMSRMLRGRKKKKKWLHGYWQFLVMFLVIVVVVVFASFANSLDFFLCSQRLPHSSLD